MESPTAVVSLLNAGCVAGSPSRLCPLPPEIEEGNIEYKLKLVSPTHTRFEHLVTQMKWRLQEGAGEAIYEIGVEDRGVLTGLTAAEMTASLETLQKMAERLGASVTVLSRVSVQPLDSEELDSSPARLAAEVLVRKVPDDQQFIDVRIAVLGNVDAGKSTLLGVLSRGELDNGKGEARLNLFRHLHEIQTGRTSSISHEIIGFGCDGQVLNFSNSKTSEDICANSSKVIHFIDVPGHHKYLKTAMFGMTGHAPHFAMLVISASTGVAGTAKEHLGMALCLHVPIFIVVSKVDLCRQSGAAACLERVHGQLKSMLQLPGCRRTSQLVNTESDAIAAACNFNQGLIVPIFTVSSVTGHNIDVLLKFLNLLPSSCNATEQQKLMQQPAEFQIDEVFSVPDVGSVVSGTLRRGVISVDGTLWLGPVEGRFVKAKVLSIHRNRLPCRVVQASQAAAISFRVIEHDGSDFPLRKGMVLLSTTNSEGVEDQPVATRTFAAEVDLLFHNESIRKGFRCTVNVGSVCQMATIGEMSKDELQTNDRARVHFHLERQAEYIVCGARLLFRQGLTRGVGQVTQTMQDGISKRDDVNHADR